MTGEPLISKEDRSMTRADVEGGAQPVCYSGGYASAVSSNRDFGDSSIDESRCFRDGLGFTLVELVIVIAILGILSGVVLFSLSGTTQTAAQSACSADAKSLETALESFKAQNGVYPVAPTGNPATVQSGFTYYNGLTSTTLPGGASSGGPYLRSDPSPSRYEIWFNAAGQVYVTKAGTTVNPGDVQFSSTPPTTPGNDFDFSNPNVCAQPGVVQ